MKKVVRPDGYIVDGETLEHRVIAERALGRKLDPKHPVHHHNGITGDNRGENLVICEDLAYHSILHFRTRIVAVGGNPDTERICSACQRLLPITDFHKDRSRYSGVDRACKQCVRQRRILASVAQ